MAVSPGNHRQVLAAQLRQAWHKLGGQPVVEVDAAVAAIREPPDHLCQPTRVHLPRLELLRHPLKQPRHCMPKLAKGPDDGRQVRRGDLATRTVADLRRDCREEPLSPRDTQCRVRPHRVAEVLPAKGLEEPRVSIRIDGRQQAPRQVPRLCKRPEQVGDVLARVGNPWFHEVRASLVDNVEEAIHLPALEDTSSSRLLLIAPVRRDPPQCVAHVLAVALADARLHVPSNGGQ
mmetsp:Transcript_40323/g.106832  ORF Transcript_40323/g.106832 Transcript_40323/m.106832 type:complete len:233 (-) Transcript_40323:687-1385(-)